MADKSGIAVSGGEDGPFPASETEFSRKFLEYYLAHKPEIKITEQE